MAPGLSAGAAATGRAEARWDRPSPFVVCRALPSQESLTDDRNRSSVLPNRRKVRRFAGVVVQMHPPRSGSQVGQTIACFRGLSRLAKPGKRDRRQKPIVCPTQSSQGAKVCRGSSTNASASSRKPGGTDHRLLSWFVAPCQARKARQTTKTDRLSYKIVARCEGLQG
jgi:hypothetical protein